MMPGQIVLEHLRGEGMTQQDLANATGLTKSTISKIVHDKRTPSTLALAKLSQALGPIFLLEYVEAISIDKRGYDEGLLGW